MKKLAKTKLALFVTAFLILTASQGCSQESSNSWECEGDCNNGEGTKKWNDGTIEKGTWVDGNIMGNGYQFFGKNSTFAGDTYEGGFLNGYHGNGTYIDVSEGGTYVGEFKNWKFHGKGKQSYGPLSKYPNRYYEGNWKNGKRHGYGVKFWGDAGEYTNNKYSGDWINDEMHGQGRYDWADGGYYVGEWRNHEKHGKGIYTFPNGKKLESQWIEGYCRELAVILYGESASSFRALIVEISTKSSKSDQEFINDLTRTFSKLVADPLLIIDYKELKESLKKSKKDNLSALSQLARIEEYDSEIPYKENYVTVRLAFQEVLNEFKGWFKIMEAKNDFSKVEELNEQIFQKLKLMKQHQLTFADTQNKFRNKYPD